jgi:hypothetical protein
MRLHFLIVGGILACGLCVLFNFEGMQKEYLFTGISLTMLLVADLIMEKIDKMTGLIEKAVDE